MAKISPEPSGAHKAITPDTRVCGGGWWMLPLHTEPLMTRPLSLAAELVPVRWKEGIRISAPTKLEQQQQQVVSSCSALGSQEQRTN